jgi:hypothetical protein
MKHLHTFETFLNEASAQKMKHYVSGTKGWGLPDNLEYAAKIKHIGGEIDIHIKVETGMPWPSKANLAVKDIGSEAVIKLKSTRLTGNGFKYTDSEDLLDVISGLKEAIKLIPTAWGEFNGIPQEKKESFFSTIGITDTVEKLAPAKKVTVDIYGEKRNLPKSRPIPEGEQEAVNEEIKKVFPNAYNIDNDPTNDIQSGALVRIYFEVNL